MKDKDFVHLHLHSEYSLVNGMVRLNELLPAIEKFAQPAVALTDHVNMFATVKFYVLALKHKIKPIIGAQLQIKRQNGISNLILLAQNNIGYKNLKILLSRSYLEGQKQGIPLCHPDWFDGFTDGLIALSAGKNGDVGQAVLGGEMAKARDYLSFWTKLFPGRYYLELIRTNRAAEEDIVNASLELAAEFKLPVVATNDVHFLTTDDFNAHEARVCINQGRVLADSRRPKDFSPGQYLTSSAEMTDKFADIPQALQNSVAIAKRCTVEIEMGKSYLPDYPLPTGVTINDCLGQLSAQGLAVRLKQLYPDNEEFARQQPIYDERLKTELAVIVDMGFAGYFLIVQDFIKWAKKHDIPVGPGRGSGAGSLVAYALDITELDPIRYGLLFERFLNPERISMPDFDIDFCMEQRDQVIDYVAQTYGRDKVSQIITFGSMNAKAVVRDAGRVLDRPYGMVDRIAKLIPFDLKMTLAKALTESDELKQRYDTEDEVKELIELAKSLEGLKRNAGRHAGGVVISPTDINDFTPIYCEEDSSSQVSQFDKDDVEAVGLVKFDFLGLRTLTIIKWALENINDEDIDIATIPLDDKKVYALLETGQTTAVFQLESRGMQDLIARLKPSSFEDIIALVALYRPGPLGSGLVDDFVQIKHGRKQATYPHPQLKEILKPTYGIMVYQEQVMQIAQVMAGYSLGEADILRRAMGKKKAEEMATQRDIFIKGATERKVKPITASAIFDMMEKFAEYGFNKSHSAAYALISYQTAWLKTHYPAQFMAAVLSADMDHTDKVVIMIEESRKLGLEVLSPDINFSSLRFSAAHLAKIVYGLGAIKGVGEAAIDIILHERAQGVFADLKDFCLRVEGGKVNKRVMEALIRCGAMDSLAPIADNTESWQGRATLLASLPIALKFAEQEKRNRQSGQVDLFSSEEGNFVYHNVAPWSDSERLYGERNTLGLFLTGHPINQYESELANFVRHKIAKITGNNKEVLFAGLLISIMVRKTKTGRTLAILLLDDRSAQIEVTLFDDVYQQFKHLLEKDSLLIIAGRACEDRYTKGIQVVANKVFDLNQARSKYAKFLQISYKNAQNTQLNELKLLLEPFLDDKCMVKISYQNEQASSLMFLGKKWQVRPDIELENRLRNLPWVDEVRLYYD